MTSDNNTSTLVPNTNISNALHDFMIKDGPIFEAVNNELMKVNMWPLMFMFLLAISGFIGNSIVLYVYWFKWKKNKTRIFILWLGFLDLANCLFNVPVEIVVLWLPIKFDFHYLCKISRGCTFVISNTGSLVFVAIAIERYILVYHPLKNLQLTTQFAKRMCSTAFFIALSVSWPSFVFYGSHTLTIPVTEHMYVTGTTCLIADENLIHKNGLILIFTSVLFALLILVFIALTLLYIAIGRKIHLATCTDINTDKKGTTTLLLRKNVTNAIVGDKQSSDNKGPSSPSIQEEEDCLGRSSVVSDTTSGADMLRLTPSKTPYKYNLTNNKVRSSRQFSTNPTRKNTVMMRMVTIAFMLSFTPFLIILVIRYTHTNSEYYLTLDRNGKIVYSVFLRSYFITSMVNPFIYGFMNIQFRKMIKDMFKHMFCSLC